jgi:hypothetical protein
VRIGRHLEPRQHRIVAIEHIVHEVGDLEPRRHRVAQRSDGEPFGQMPLHVHRQARVARVHPITVPARRGAHVDRELDLAARRRRAFGDQLRLDAARVRQRREEQKADQEEKVSEH